MRRLKTLVSIGDGTVSNCDTVLVLQKWLVPSGVEATLANSLPPAQAILLEDLEYKPANPDYGADWVLNTIIPTAVWKGTRSDPRFTTIARSLLLIKALASDVLAADNAEARRLYAASLADVPIGRLRSHFVDSTGD